MNIKVFKNSAFATRAAADYIIAQISQKSDSVLGLPTGSTPLGTYKTLIEAFCEGRVSFKNVKTFNLDEYVGLSPEHEQSYRYFMNSNLFNHIDIDIENTCMPCDGTDITDEEASLYDTKINAAGGIDLQLLGIGNNGHIAFNEPGGYIGSLTHKQKISQNTIEANARFFGGDVNAVPKYAVTLGIRGIMNARKIILLALGSGKAQAVYDTICGPVTAAVPASILNLHPDCTVLCDEEAASMIIKHFQS